MTAWTTPTTWASGNVPTAANFNTQVRDNMLHLREGSDGLGFAMSVIDPRVNLVGSYLGAGAARTCYLRGVGACPTVRAIRIRVTATAGTFDIGFYDNIGEGQGPSPASAAAPNMLKDSAGDDTPFPAIGTADVLMAGGTAAFNQGDWFAYAGDTGGGTQAIYTAGSGSASGRLGGGRGWMSSDIAIGREAKPANPTCVFWVMFAIT